MIFNLGMLSINQFNDKLIKLIIVSIHQTFEVEIGVGLWLNCQENQSQIKFWLVQEEMNQVSIYGLSVHLNCNEVMIEPISQQYSLNLDYEIHGLCEVINNEPLKIIIHTNILGWGFKHINNMFRLIIGILKKYKNKESTFERCFSLLINISSLCECSTSIVCIEYFVHIINQSNYIISFSITWYQITNLCCSIFNYYWWYFSFESIAWTSM